MATKRKLTVAIQLSLLAGSVFADNQSIEEIDVFGDAPDNNPAKVLAAKVGELPIVDTADLLQRLPGGNINSNGPITTIAQYRGLYGDRVSVNLDNAPIVSGGPNAMDTPLSYAPPTLLKSIQLNRGIAPVSAAQESIGGHISAALDRGQFGDSDKIETTGYFSTGYQGVYNGTSNGIQLGLANQSHKLSALASYDEGNDTEIGDGDKVTGTDFHRARYDVSYGWQNDKTNIELYAGWLDTRDTGTPALAMDIKSIKTSLMGLNFSTQLYSAVFSGQLSYNHVDHKMNNFDQRETANPTAHRSNKVRAHNGAWRFQLRWPVASGHLTVGTDGNQTVHNSKISNPNNPAFNVRNLDDAKRDIYGIFTEWEGSINEWNLQGGLRYNQVEMDADRVSAAGAMGMAATNIGALVSGFNQSDRSERYHNFDIVINSARALNSDANLNIGLGKKSRAPSYLERGLWLPLSATGGLADGRNYIGNLGLNSETAYEITTGIDWQFGNAWVSPQLFYRYIDDYIQGGPTAQPQANMVSMMMSGKPALQYQNIDAEMFGADMAYGYKLTPTLRLEGNLSYVRGERQNGDDDLYRIAPLNNRLALVYQAEQLMLSAESVLYAKQTKVADFNDEEKTAGYGILNLSAGYKLTEQISFSGGVGNVFDKRYHDHLAGYNRRADSDLDVGERLVGAGRNMYVSAKLSW